MASIDIAERPQEPTARSRCCTASTSTIDDGEFVVLVGPSGCGKSTLLRMIAGLEEISAGEIRIDGAARQRPGAQGPRHRHGVPVLRALSAYERRRQHELQPAAAESRPRRRSPTRSPAPPRSSASSRCWSAGRGRCRAASASASPWAAPSCAQPKAFLFDEPLSNLDARLREQMRAEIKKLHRDLGATSIYVTHDQIEAMTLADRIVAMHGGVVQQVGTPLDLYDRPANLFVAGFIGSPAMNFLDGALWVATARPARVWPTAR